MNSTPQSRLELLLKLIEIPSVTESDHEDEAVQFIYQHLAGQKYFKAHPQHLTLLPTPRERDPRPLHSLLARVMAGKPTKRTIVMIGHYDVVEVSMYGEMRHLAFKPMDFQQVLLKNPQLLSPQGREDLESGHYLFGRGSMDMKCGLAIEMELLRDFGSNPEMFDVNLLMLAVADEENSSAGMRGVIAELVRLQEEEGLEYICAMNTEPTEPGRPGAAGQILFTGTVGKLMPVFLCVGQESHVGNYYKGLSAPLMAANIIKLAEAKPELADPAGENTCPSWICLGNQILREGYSVTVPNRAVAYFNCFSVNKTPAAIMAEMQEIAQTASRETLAQVWSSSNKLLEMGYANGKAPQWELPVLTIEDLVQDAVARLGSKEALVLKIKEATANSSATDLRDLAIVAMQEILLHSGRPGPMIVVGFLPPYYPPRNNKVPTHKFVAVNRAVEDILQQARSQYQVEIEECPLFAGICDLSYMGFQGAPEELAVFKQNLADQGALYYLPTNLLTRLDVPIINLGPCGYEAHKFEERLELKYSLDTLPKLFEYAIKRIAQHNGQA